MPQLAAGVIRRMVVAGTAIAVFAVPAVAHAQTAGSLAQLASPNDCIESTSTDVGCSSTAEGLTQTKDVAITPDGKNVYVISTTDESIAEFAHNADGSLSPIGCIVEQGASGSTCTDGTTAVGLASPQAIAVSPTGNDVYVAGFDDSDLGDVAAFARNADGTLTQLSPGGCIAESQEAISECGSDRAFGLKGPSAIAVSPDGQNVYVTDRTGPAVTELTRAADGSLSQPGGTSDCIGQVDSSNTDCATQAQGVNAVDAIVVSPDGHNVYTGSNSSPGAIAEFARATNGSLTQLASPNDCIQEQTDSLECGTNNAVGVQQVVSLAVSPDGTNVYATSQGSNSIAEFSRDPNAQGALTQLPSPNDCIEEQGSSEACGTDGVGLNGAGGVQVSPDGHNVYVATQADDCCDAAIAEFARASDGSLTQLASPDECIDSGGDCDTAGTGLGGGALAVAPDDTNVYVIGDEDVAEFARTPVQHTLAVSVGGSGGGAVSDGSGGISCPSTCSHSYNEGTQVTLTATPASGSTFAGWSGACSGTASCVVTMSADMTLTATFSGGPGAPGAPTPVITGAPSAVTDSGAGFSGSVNPEGLPTTVFFQYGLDKRYSQVGASGPDYTAQTPGQAVGSDFSTHGVGPVTVTGLVPNALYHLRLVATNSAGTAFGQDVTFTTALAPAPAPPTIGQTFNVAPVSGLVLVLIHGHLVPLTQIQQLPPGVTIDSLHGTFQLITATGGGGPAHDAAKGKTQSGKFGGAVVRLHQAKSGRNRGLTTIMMVESAFKGAPSQAICSVGKAGDAHAAKAGKVIQLLHASAHGKFSTSGRYAAATVRGTVWSMTARCDGTLTHDFTDSVAVTDFIRHKTIVLHAGQSYLAPARHKG